MKKLVNNRVHPTCTVCMRRTEEHGATKDLIVYTCPHCKKLFFTCK